MRSLNERAATIYQRDLDAYELAAQRERKGRAPAVVRLAGRVIGYLVLIVAMYLGGFVLGQAWAGAW